MVRIVKVNIYGVKVDTKVIQKILFYETRRVLTDPRLSITRTTKQSKRQRLQRRYRTPALKNQLSSAHENLWYNVEDPLNFGPVTWFEFHIPPITIFQLR